MLPFELSIYCTVEQHGSILTVDQVGLGQFCYILFICLYILLNKNTLYSLFSKQDNLVTFY
jgi:hypothetical protein